MAVTLMLSRHLARAAGAAAVRPVRHARGAYVAAFKGAHNDKHAAAPDNLPGKPPSTPQQQQQMQQQQQEQQQQHRQRQQTGMAKAVMPEALVPGYAAMPALRRFDDMLSEMQSAMDTMTRELMPGFSDDDFFAPRGRGRGRGALAAGWPHASLEALVSPEAGAVRTASAHIDVQETDKAYVIVAEVPGFSKEDIKVQLLPDGVLNLSAEHNEETEEKLEGDTTPRAFSRRLSRFSRSFRLPKDVGEDITASAKDGILTVTVPKHVKEQIPAKEIPIA